MHDFPNPKFVDSNGVKLATYEMGTGPAVLFVHGWPEIAYSWKHQMTAVAAAGYRAIALDLRGFGASDTPFDIAQYDIQHLTDDLSAVLDTYGVEKAVICGHDWGGVIAWPMAQLKPERVSGVIGVCTAHFPPLAIPTIEKIAAGRDENHYIVQFNRDLEIEKLFDDNIEKFFRTVFQKAPKRAESEKLGNRLFDIPGRLKNGPMPMGTALVLSDDDLQTYVDIYKKSGFRGGINLYRNIDQNHALMEKVDPKINVPCLWIGAEDDIFLPIEYAAYMKRYIRDLEKQVIKDCGHWVTWEQPEHLNKHMVEWLNDKF